MTKEQEEKQMTNEEAIKNLEHLGVEGVVDATLYEIGQAVTMAIEALKYEEKCRWHNLKENPEDLPDGRGYYLVEIPTFCWGQRAYVVARFNHQNIWTYDGNVIPQTKLLRWKNL